MPTKKDAIEFGIGMLAAVGFTIAAAVARVEPGVDWDVFGTSVGVAALRTAGIYAMARWSSWRVTK